MKGNSAKKACNAFTVIALYRASSHISMDTYNCIKVPIAPN